jgi:hypothetical protein
MWSDPNLNDFYKRVARIEYAHARGHGFLASGALSRADFYGRKRERTPILGPLFLVICFGFMLKGAIHYNIGAEVYDARVASLLEEKGIDRLGGMLMQADPVTLFVSGHIASAREEGGVLAFAG